jgi:hypothetical protein
MTHTFDDLMHQASMTAHDYFINACKVIDDKFGDGYAEKHPELISAFMQTAASDFNTCAYTKILSESAREITESIEILANKI